MVAHRWSIGVLIAGGLLALAGGVQAQATVGEVLDGGGVRVSREKMTALMPGATVSGPTESGGEFSADIKAEGKVSGWVRSATGRNGSVFGKWQINEDGQFCREITVSIGMTNNTDSDCRYMFKLGNRYYSAESLDRSSSVLVRKIVKE
ncbi:MAG: hypothetical protein JNJ44_01855 [Zoogloeaceae bacterium]|nr:hypothetical protein [Zoogloeaceae bacterium]